MNSRSFLLTILLGVSFSHTALASETPRIQSLSDELIQAHKGDVVGLWNDWIKPQVKQCNLGWGIVGFTENEHKGPTEAAIEKDFSRFCSANGGAVSTEALPYGHKYTCNTSTGEYLGEFSTQREDGCLDVYAMSPQQRQDKIEAQQKYEALVMTNGPTDANSCGRTG